MKNAPTKSPRSTAAIVSDGAPWIECALLVFTIVLLIELKDKMMNLFDGEEIQIFGNNTIKDEALSALEVLGYSRKQSERILDQIIQTAPDSSIEELIKEALNKL